MIAQRLLEIPFIQRSNALRTFITAAWLGWQIESNWADPFLFAVYSIAKPLATVSILVVMYSVISDEGFSNPLFAYIYLGNALYIMVGQIMNGISWTVIDDREHYRTMKQLHTTPMNYYAYLMGRGMARLLIALFSVSITIGVGMIAFELPITVGNFDLPLFLISMILGVICLACMGLILGSLTLTMARHFWGMGEAVAGALYLFTGAIFPIDILPKILQPIGFIFPVTYWLELTRRAMLGDEMQSFPTLAHFSNAELIAILSVMTVFIIAISIWVYRWSMHMALEKGLIDMETNY